MFFSKMIVVTLETFCTIQTSEADVGDASTIYKIKQENIQIIVSTSTK
jgi:hypothetical protein